MGEGTAAGTDAEECPATGTYFDKGVVAGAGEGEGEDATANLG